MALLIKLLANDFRREKEALSVELNEVKAELAAVTMQRDDLEKTNLETRLQVWCSIRWCIYCIGSGSAKSAL